ncbi:3-hydroxyacyl-CoA dehydrogenase, NAD binding domain-containing protein [Ditylenchus destructor]|uniref:3-hydroxyacyl-CoA dehydrogenase n=1 Tax=Ditylenchus destructor TaxID=166010 RepID=A0AAD4N987_9BILA|nr:3-hydroxyacyl-CoA dehydrogenase, NAD binding domain-containing protein [Ditylenchus destructor]
MPEKMIETTFPAQVNNIVIVGTGLMGTGIAQVAVESGVHVTMVGRTEEKCEGARTKISNGVNKTAKRKLANESPETQQGFVSTTLANLEFVTDVFSANLDSTDMVVEAVVENLKVKQKLFTDLEAVVPSHCLLVTNTSSFLLEDVSCKMGERRKNFGGLHFFNPVPAMKLVEVVRGLETSDEAYDSLFRFCQRIGKQPVRCKDSPGFIVNRLLMPYLADAMRLAESGDAEVKDIDTAMRLGTGHPMGPFELMDYIGLDTMKFILDGWHQRMPEDHRYTPCNSLEKLVSAGKLGRKTGEGFHRYAK